MRVEAEGCTKNWTERYFLNEKSLIEMHDLISEIKERLDKLGIREPEGVHRAKWSHAERSIIMKVAIAGMLNQNFY